MKFLDILFGIIFLIVLPAFACAGIGAFAVGGTITMGAIFFFICCGLLGWDNLLRAFKKESSCKCTG